MLQRIPLARSLVNKARGANGAIAKVLKRLPQSSVTIGPPKGYCWTVDDLANERSGFNVVKQAVQPGVTVRVERPSDVQPGEFPAFFEPFEYTTSEGHFIEVEEMRLCSYPPGFRYPNAFVTPTDQLLLSHSFWWGTPEQHTVFSKVWLGKCRRIKGRSFYFGGGSNYFHYLFDTIPRLAVMQASGVSLSSFDHIIMLSPVLPFEHALLSLLNLPTDKLIFHDQEKHLAFDSLALGPELWHWRYGRWIADHLRVVFQPFFQQLGQGKRRIYISREKAVSRHVENEAEVLALLKTFGFEKILLEDLTVQEQVNLFRSAEMVVGPEGAGFTNLIFCDEGTQVLHFHPSSGNARINPDWSCWWKLCNMSKFPYRVLICEGNDRVGRAEGSSMRVDVRVLEKMLKEALDGVRSPMSET